MMKRHVIQRAAARPRFRDHSIQANQPGHATSPLRWGIFSGISTIVPEARTSSLR